MKFCKKYEEYMQGQGKKTLPGVGFKNLKKILKKCRKQPNSQTLIDYQNNDNNNNNNNNDDDNDHGDLIPHDHISTCLTHCSVCDGTFFPALLEEMSVVVGTFNQRAQRLIELHMASGLSKCAFWLKGKLQRKHIVTLTQEGRDLVNYAVFNAIAMRKILKKYDKVHYSKQGQAFKSQARSMHIEILKSPLLCELMAFHINLLTTSKRNPRPAPVLLEGCSLVVLNENDANPSLHCELFDSAKLDTDLTCSICLETLFDPVSLTCGHMFCYFCACKAASVTIVDGLKAAKPDNKCPMCREGGVYKGAVHLAEMHILIRRSCPGYWKERRDSEKRERVKQAKEHWESKCRLFAGV